jgi:hypothetical protein
LQLTVHVWPSLAVPHAEKSVESAGPESGAQFVEAAGAKLLFASGVDMAAQTLVGKRI